MKALAGALSVAILMSLVTVVAVAGSLRVSSGEWRLPERTDVQKLVETLRPEPKPSRVVYLHWAELEVRGGYDDASAGTSSLLAVGTAFHTPRYRAGNKSWRRLVKCVENKFAAYDVTITDERPATGDYVLVKIGGRPEHIGKGDKKVGGLAPFNGQAIANSIVFVFDQKGRYRTKNNCETAAHEIGHVYSLDHTYQCGDLMSYRQGCGKKKFVDEPMPCGEYEPRACKPGAPSQNSAKRLLAVLGAARNR